MHGSCSCDGRNGPGSICDLTATHPTVRDSQINDCEFPETAVTLSVKLKLLSIIVRITRHVDVLLS